VADGVLDGLRCPELANVVVDELNLADEVVVVRAHSPGGRQPSTDCRYSTRGLRSGCLPRLTDGATAGKAVAIEYRSAGFDAAIRSRYRRRLAAG
jgi:hypothetical protein